MPNLHELREQEEELSSPITPGPIFDEEKALVYNFYPTITKNKVTTFKPKFPLAIGCISVLQIIIHIFANNKIRTVLRFEPRKQQEVWRFITYMLVHDDWVHLGLNVMMQCIFALFLECRQGPGRVCLLYILAGFTGVLGASCVQPYLVIGASAGVYALLISNIADISLNFAIIKYKISRLVCIGVTVISDIVYNVIHFYSKEDPPISWMAHLVGGVTGLLIGLVLYRNHDSQEKYKIFNKFLFWTGLFLYGLLFIFLVILTFQIKKCTEFNVVQVTYIYFC